MLSLTLLAGRFLAADEAPTIARWNQIKLGDSMALILKRFGPPTYEYEAKSAPTDYYLSGYQKRERPISNRVLIYVEGDLALYVWIDRLNCVEDMYWGGS
jgi:hypothetical protein